MSKETVKIGPKRFRKMVREQVRKVLREDVSDLDRDVVEAIENFSGNDVVNGYSDYMGATVWVAQDSEGHVYTGMGTTEYVEYTQSPVNKSWEEIRNAFEEGMTTPGRGHYDKMGFNSDRPKSFDYTEYV